VIIAGNHDFAFEQSAAAAEALVPRGVTYLRNSGVTLDGVRFWGSPYQPEFFDWAFNLKRGAPLARVWAKIPSDVQVLVTHGPPSGILDRVRPSGRHEGCEDLARRLAELPQLSLHAYGHIHEDYGSVKIGNCTYVNASICTLEYAPVNAPLVVDL
jgi:predicted phosphohydrolase